MDLPDRRTRDAPERQRVQTWTCTQSQRHQQTVSHTGPPVSGIVLASSPKRAQAYAMSDERGSLAAAHSASRSALSFAGNDSSSHVRLSEVEEPEGGHRHLTGHGAGGVSAALRPQRARGAEWRAVGG